MGAGRDGHIGFNESDSSLGSRTRLKTLTEETVRDNASFFGGEEKLSRLAVTMGIGIILEARKLLMLASGAEKAGAVKEAIEGPLSSQVTVSALQLHHKVIVIVDEKVGRLLEWREYHRYVEKIAEGLNTTPESELRSGRVAVAFVACQIRRARP